MMYFKGRRNQFRIAVITLISLVAVLFFQNCGGGVSSQASIVGSSTAGSNGNNSSSSTGTTGGTTPPATTPPTSTPTTPTLLAQDNNLLMSLCNPYINTANEATFVAQPTISGSLYSGGGDGGTNLGNLDSSNNSVKISFNINPMIVNNGAGATGIIPPAQYVQTPVNCTFNSTVTLSVVTGDSAHPNTFTNAIDVNPASATYGQNVASAAMFDTIANKSIKLTNIAMAAPTTTTAGTANINLDRDADGYRCVAGSFYVKMKVRTQVLTFNRTADYAAADSNYKYVQINMVNSCWTESVLAPPAAPVKIAGYGTVVAASTNWMAVLAPKDDGSDGAGGTITGTGTVSVFQNNAGKWGFCQKITVPNAVQFEALTSVAVSDDGKLVIGAGNQNGQSGNVYIYNNNGQACSSNPWSNVQMISAPSADSSNANQNFGASLAINNGNLVVGAPGANAKKGNAYVYSCTSTTCSYRYTLANSAGTQAAFGSSLALSGSLLAVGAPQAIASEYLGDGFVNVYDITAAAVLKATVAPGDGGGASNPSAMRYGDSVSLSGSKLAVGAPFKSNATMTGIGGAYYYANYANAAAEVKINGPSVANSFVGRSVALASTGLFVGSDGFNSREGRVAYYDNSKLSSTSLSYNTSAPSYFLFGFNKTASNDYGFSVAVTGSTVVIGAKNKPSPNNGGGLAYSYGIR
ncbi:MAG: hypothetical protein ACXWQQ_00205 [Pseudobdellovibrio sp.]